MTRVLIFAAVLRHLLRNATLSSPAAYAKAKRIGIGLQWALRRVHDPDFRPFSALSGGGFFVDIGANIGQSAISFASMCASFTIESFEANPYLADDLAFVRSLIGPRFSYRMTALGEKREPRTLYVPHAGEVPLTQAASFDRDFAISRIPQIEANVRRRVTLESAKVDVVPFDDLSLSPDVVKIDVEGAEPQVLRGMFDTIKRSIPSMLIESPASGDEVKALLSPFGYTFIQRSVNVFAIHRDRMNSATMAAVSKSSSAAGGGAAHSSRS